MAFRRISYLIPSCDGCGLAWSFFDPACAEGIPPHFASRAAALEQLPGDYGCQVRPCRLGRPLMACRTCAAAGVIPAGAFRRWLLVMAGWVRRLARQLQLEADLAAADLAESGYDRWPPVGADRHGRGCECPECYAPEPDVYGPGPEAGLDREPAP